MATKAKKKTGLYANVDKKRKRIAAGSGEKMRKPGSKGAPKAGAFKMAAKTAKKKPAAAKGKGRKAATKKATQKSASRTAAKKTAKKAAKKSARKSGTKKTAAGRRKTAAR